MCVQDPLAPPDLLVNANMRHNWRTGKYRFVRGRMKLTCDVAWSFFDEQKPIGKLPHDRVDTPD